MSAKSWVARAESALAGRDAEGADRLMRGRRPPLLDADGVRAVLAPLLAAVVWGSAIFREVVAGTPLDPLALGLRVLALALTLRVAVLGATFVTRAIITLRASRYGLVLTPEGLFYRAPELDIAIPRDAIVGIAERGHWQARGGPRRWSEVFVITDPAIGRTHVALPPVFEDTPGLLAERLMRWRGPDPAVPEPEPAAPAPLASQLWDDAASGRAPEGVAAIPHGLEWLRRAPYLPFVFAFAAADGLARAGNRAWDVLDPMLGGALFVAFLAIPARWWWTTRRDVKPRKGLSMVLTRAELLLRTHQGIVRVRWSELDRASTDTQRKWSVLEGAFDLRRLVIMRRSAPAIRFDEPFLGLPVEVAQQLVDAYKHGRLPRAEGPPTAPPDESE